MSDELTCDSSDDNAPVCTDSDAGTDSSSGAGDDYTAPSDADTFGPTDKSVEAQPADSADSETDQAVASYGPSGPREEDRTYGTFEVYKDDFIGPLPAPDYQTGDWAVHESEMNTIDQTISSVDSGDSTFRLNGDDAFKQRTESDMAYLMTTPTGLDLVESEMTTGKHVTINQTDGKNSEKGDSSQGDLRKDGTPGAGTDASIQYNPQIETIGDGSEDWMHRAPAIGLGHELVHAYADSTGTTPTGTTDGIADEERQAIGLPPYDNSEFSEDQIRAEVDAPQRTR